MRSSHDSETLLGLKTNARAACQLIHQKPTQSSNSQSPFIHSSVWHRSVVFSTLSKLISTSMKLQQEPGALARVWKFLSSKVHRQGTQQQQLHLLSWPRKTGSKGGVAAVGRRTPWFPAATSTKRYRPLQVHLPWTTDVHPVSQIPSW